MTDNDNPARSGVGDLYTIEQRLNKAFRWGDTVILLRKLANYRGMARKAQALMTIYGEYWNALLDARITANDKGLPLHIRQQGEARIKDAEARLDALAADAAKLARGG